MKGEIVYITLLLLSIVFIKTNLLLLSVAFIKTALRLMFLLTLFVLFFLYVVCSYGFCSLS